jgi:hypothetical protein
MSSPDFPTLHLDVSARRTERALALVVLSLAVLATFLLFQQSFVTIAIAALCSTLTIGIAFRRFGWLGGARRLTRVVCQPDGQWVLSDVGGRRIECELKSSSRITARALWLEWTGGGGPPLLLLAGDVPAADFRRLVVRLRLGRLSSEGANHVS